MEYIVESSLRDFNAWSGGEDTLAVLIEKGDCDAVESYIDDLFCDSDPTDTDINDFLWFERDEIAMHLGYRDWDAYTEGWSGEDLQDANDWFDDDMTYESLAAIAGIERKDYKDAYDFCRAIDEWWDSLEDGEKVEIYHQNS